MNPRSRRRAVGLILAAILAVAASACLVLPRIIRRQVNARLNAIPGYGGRVGWVSVDLGRRSYTLHDFLVVKRNGRVRWPYFHSPAIEIVVGWRPWRRGGPWAKIRVKSAVITFVQGADAEASQMDVDARWTRAVHAIFPLPIARLEIEGGRLLYLDDSRQPKLALSVTDLHVLAIDRGDSAPAPWPASVEMDGCCLGGGRLQALVLAEPDALQPHFSISADLRDVSLPALNDVFAAYADVGLKRGTLRMRMKIDGRNGRFDGYIRPSFDHLEFTWVGDKGRGLGSEIIGSLAAAMANLMKKQVEQRLENEIPIEGSFGENQNDFLATFKALVRAGGRLPLAQTAVVTSR